MIQRKVTSDISALAAVLVTAFAANTAAAQSDPPAQEEHDGYVTVLPFYFAADANRRGTSEDGRGTAIGYGHRMGDKWLWEMQTFAGVIATDQVNLPDFYQYGAGADLGFRFRRGDGASPFVLIGAGILRNDIVTDKDNDFYSNLGLGFVSGPLGKSEIRLRGEVRYVRDRFQIDSASSEGKKNDRRLAIGVQVPLGRRIVDRVVEREVERVVTEQVPAAIVDTDNDGVPDQNDRCPGTLAGLATDNRGCAATSPQMLRLEGVNFEYNSAQLTADASTTLREVADALRGEPNLRAEIAGHTDSNGSDAYNLNLSQQRANSVLTFLAGQGIDRSRLVARGYGEGQPVADNGTDAGRERNRRVEFRVLN
ncbi:MAG TPA: OmpA family protein [Gammaproteobacteria bacterium]|nr:OmpA family protein [Gammaproteobacteria bacterium]